MTSLGEVQEILTESASPPTGQAASNCLPWAPPARQPGGPWPALGGTSLSVCTQTSACCASESGEGPGLVYWVLGGHFCHTGIETLHFSSSPHSDCGFQTLHLGHALGFGHLGRPGGVILDGCRELWIKQAGREGLGLPRKTARGARTFSRVSALGPTVPSRTNYS